MSGDPEMVDPEADTPPGAPAPYHAIANLYFDSLPTLQSALMATAEELIADVPNYYAGQSEVQIAEVVES